jgi:hypothetical protein
MFQNCFVWEALPTIPPYSIQKAAHEEMADCVLMCAPAEPRDGRVR